MRLTAVPVLGLAVTLLAGALGGRAASLAGLPIPMLLGALGITAAIALTGWRPFGVRPMVPPWLRSLAMVALGVTIGGAIPPGILGQLAAWVPSLLLLAVFLPVAQAAGYGLFRLGGIPHAEAWFGSVPGGLIETVQFAEEAGADIGVITILQFLRLILTVVIVPFVFMLMTGQAVGSAAGIALPGGGGPLSWPGLAALAVLGAVGWRGAERLRLPAAPMMGPLILSALAHGSGQMTAVPPGWVLDATQVAIGCALGTRFAGTPRGLLLRAGGLSVGNAALSLGLALAFAMSARGWVEAPTVAVFLAYAPGGLAEMSLVALSLQVDLVFVTLHHLLRIVLSVTIARLGALRMIRQAGHRRRDGQ